MIASRRLVTVPLVTATMVCVVASGPVPLAGTALAGLVMRSTRPVRSAALVMAYAFVELRTLLKLATSDLDGDRLAQEFLTAAYSAARRILDIEVVLDPASATPDVVSRDKPVIVLSRHCGPGDSLLVAWLLMAQYRLQIRAVLNASPTYRRCLRCRGRRAGGLCVGVDPQRLLP